MLLSQSARNNLRFSFVIIAILISLNFWSFRLLPESVYRVLEAALLGGLIFFVFTSSAKITEKLLFRDNVILFIAIPLLSGISAFIYHDQPLHLSLLILRTNFFWLLYFVLHFFNVKEKQLLRLLLAMGLMWMLITVVQQFTYPVYYFYSKDESDSYSILRAGIYRFMAYGHQYGTFVLIYCVYMYFVRRKVLYLVITIFSLIAFYYYGTRQFAVAGLACIPFAIFFLKGSTRLIALAVAIIGGCVLFYFRDQLFSQYVAMTREQLQFGEDVRQRSAKFWLNEYWPHWTATIFGNGRPHIGSEYGQEVEAIRSKFHFYRSDVGIAGALNEFGILYVLNILIVNIKGLRSWNLLKHDKYLVLLFLNLTILLPTSLYYANSAGIPFYCCLFYLFEKACSRKRQALSTVQVVDAQRKHSFGLSN